MMAVSCGTPTPATMRVVQIEPGPMPTLIESAPASISALAPSPVAMLPATTCTAFDSRLMRVTASSTDARMAVRGVDDDEIDAGLDQPFGALEALVADGGRRRHAQPPLLVLAGVGIGDRLLDVLDRDQPDAAILRIDHQELLDAVLVQEALGLLLIDALAHGDELVLGHQLGDGLAQIGRKAHVAVGEDADELAGLCPLPPPSTTGMPEMPCALHQVERVGERGARMDGHRIDHHAGLELLDLADLRGLLVGLEVAVDDADPAGLRHGDRHLGFGHRVHGGGDDRHVER